MAAYLPPGTWYSLHDVSQVCGRIHLSVLFNRIQQGFTVPRRFILMFNYIEQNPRLKLTAVTKTEPSVF